MIKQMIGFCILFFTVNSLTAQIVNPVKWSTSVEKISEEEYLLITKAELEDGWHLYSQNVPEEIPVATVLEYGSSSGVDFIGNTIEENVVEKEDPVFETSLKVFDEFAIFKQKIKLTDKQVQSLTVEIEYMACDDTRCLPPTMQELSFDIANASPSEDQTISEPIESSAAEKGLLSIFLISFFSGFLALLTPCVFPMIPMTVSFFMKQGQGKAKGIQQAVIYGLSIIVIYVLLGSFITGIFGASALNALATNPWFNLLFFVLLLVFALSFLGAFEIVLPHKWVNRVDKQADKGGMVGIFFMALALAIVSFSCTGPIVGTLLVEASSKGGIAPIVGMLGFSTAIAFPFTLFAIFPNWLTSLPKSGSWLNTVKVVLGFLELALALKFLSNADLVLQLHLITREVFIALWIAIFGALTLYLFGKIKLPHDSKLPSLSVGRLFLGLMSLSFTIYLIPGLWGAPLNMISAFPPPQHYSESPDGIGFTTHEPKVGIEQIEVPSNAELIKPHNIIAFKDYDKGMAYAKEVNKPVLLDFTGWACVNCRKMEQNVWSKAPILKALKNDVVVISLYVDDKRMLPNDEVTQSQLNPKKQLKYIGQKWSEFQTIKYKTNTQPFYVLVNHEEENLNQPIGYTPNPNQYLQWIKSGLEKFEK